jgi:hypothetical protein
VDKDLSDKQIAEKQKEYLEDAIEEGSVFEDMVKHNGWKMILNNYQNELRLFINDLMLNDKPIGDYEFKRRELMGMQKLITRIDNSIKVAIDERSKSEKPT